MQDGESGDVRAPFDAYQSDYNELGHMYDQRIAEINALRESFRKLEDECNALANICRELSEEARTLKQDVDDACARSERWRTAFRYAVEAFHGDED